MFTWLKSLRHGERRRDPAEALSRAIVPVLERLEGRRLLAVSCGTASGGAWTVSSDNSGDNIEFRTENAMLIVKQAGGSDLCSTAESGVSNLTVNMSGGNDTVTIGDSVGSSVAITVNGGDGTDSLVGEMTEKPSMVTRARTP